MTEVLKLECMASVTKLNIQDAGYGTPEMLELQYCHR